MVFSYNVFMLFELIKSKPCLWDKNSEESRNRIARDMAWEDIFRFLVVDYDKKSNEQKKEAGEEIMAKWVNVRDAFTRSLKHRQGKSPKKQYIYAEYLQFLAKPHQECAASESYPPPTKTEEHEELILPNSVVLPHKRPSDVGGKGNPELKRTKSDSRAECQFFKSFEEYVEDMDDGEKLELHLAILNTIMDIKSRRKGDQDI